MGDDIADEMVSEEGTAPALEVDSDQRAKLLRKWRDGKSRYGDEPDVKGDLEGR